MVNPVGFRFRPTDEEIIDHYLRLKNLGGSTSHVDEAISTVNICSFDPWDLPSQSRMESRDQVWYFFGLKEKKYNRGERQSRKTSSGFWKKTGKTMEIMRKRGNREKMGEKRVLVFHSSGSKTKWVMHEYHATSLSPNQMMTYTICKVKFKGEKRDFSSSSGGEIVEHSHSLITQMNNSGGLSTGSEVGQSQTLTGSEEETQLEDAMRRAINNLSPDDWRSLFNDDDEQGKIMFTQEDRNDYRPKKPLTGVFGGHSSDDSDSDSISATTISIQTSSTCDSFASSNRGIDLQESPNLTVELSQKVSQAVGQGTETGEHKLGQESTKNKRAGSFYSILQGFVKKIQLCSCISRT